MEILKFIKLLSMLCMLLALLQSSTSLPIAGTDLLEISTQDKETLAYNKFIRLAFHSTAKLGNKIHIRGGEINLIRDDHWPGTVTLNNTITLDLTMSWESATIQYEVIENDLGAPLLNYGTLWPSIDNSSIFSFGGIRPAVKFSPAIPSVAIWRHDTGGWSGLTSQDSASPTFRDVRPALAATTHGENIGYMLGGIKGNNPAPYWPLPGLLTYNMTDNTWKNESTSALTLIGLIGGSLTYVPNFGSQGVLIAMGGEYANPGPWAEPAANFIPFTNISVWDIATKTWYWQGATANNDISDIPAGATMFCSTGVGSQNGTYEIFVYGGHDDTFVLGNVPTSAINNAAQARFNTVYALSLPGFVWTKVNSDAFTARTGHTCNLIGNRQMLSIGGLNPELGYKATQYVDDEFAQGLGIFDMVELEWKQSYDADAAPYSTAPIIASWYTKNGASMNETMSGITWSSAGVQALFSAWNIIDTSPSPEPQDSKSGISKTDTAIVASVGSLIALALVIFLGWKLYRRLVKKESAAPWKLDEMMTALVNFFKKKQVAVESSDPDVEPDTVVQDLPPPSVNDVASAEPSRTPAIVNEVTSTEPSRTPERRPSFINRMFAKMLGTGQLVQFGNDERMSDGPARLVSRQLVQPGNDGTTSIGPEMSVSASIHNVESLSDVLSSSQSSSETIYQDCETPVESSSSVAQSESSSSRLGEAVDSFELQPFIPGRAYSV